MIKQKVVRTCTYGNGSTERLEELLEEGYIVKHITRRNDDEIEYIVEREEE